jgi:hypothetical protein
LEYVHLLLADIAGRQHQFKPYGIATTKKLARSSGINPVWYVDISPSHDWLSKSINRLSNRAIEEGPFDQSDIARLAPFLEQMGTNEGSPSAGPYRKEFWWEREWRHVGNYPLPSRIIVLCPESEMGEFKKIPEESCVEAGLIDPRWGLEQIIARLAGFPFV